MVELSKIQSKLQFVIFFIDASAEHNNTFRQEPISMTTKVTCNMIWQAQIKALHYKFMGCNSACEPPMKTQSAKDFASQTSKNSMTKNISSNVLCGKNFEP